MSLSDMNLRWSTNLTLRVAFTARSREGNVSPPGHRTTTRARKPVAQEDMPLLGTTDLDVFPLCLGGNVFSWTANEQESFALLDAYLAAGGNFIDTADSYTAWVPGHVGGESETIIGHWIAARGARNRVIIATKVGRAPGRIGAGAEEHPRWCRGIAETSGRRSNRFVLRAR